ncbi:MAG: hypothetical protein ACLQCB_22270 [Spirochaetia bacterium]
MKKTAKVMTSFLLIGMFLNAGRKLNSICSMALMGEKSVISVQALAQEAVAVVQSPARGEAWDEAA